MSDAVAVTRPIQDSEDPKTFVVYLEGCKSGNWDAAEAFANAFVGLKKRFPEGRFQIVPFRSDEDGVNSYLAVYFG